MDAALPEIVTAEGVRIYNANTDIVKALYRIIKAYPTL